MMPNFVQKKKERIEMKLKKGVVPVVSMSADRPKVTESAQNP